MSISILNPVTGKVVPTSKVKDDTFSQNMMGEGFAVIPSSNEFVSPVNGEITLVEGHAIGLKTQEGLELLIHIGLDTVQIDPELKAKIFAHKHKVGDKVKAGAPLVTVDVEAIKKEGKDTITPVIVLADSLNGKSVSMENMGELEAGEKILSVE